MEERIIIAGAGAAGLMAARELSAAGYMVAITEANSRTGGRIRTIFNNDLAGPLEAGAEFVHGNLAVTNKLVAEANGRIEPVGGHMYSVINGKWNMQDNMAPGWEDMLARMHALKEDMTIAGFLDRYFADKKYTVLRRSVQSFAEGFDLADIYKANVFAVRDEWQSEMEQQFRVQGGYGQLMQYLQQQCLANGCTLHTSCAVKTVSWKKGAVRVQTTAGEWMEGNRLIITVPLSVLQAHASHPSAIRFHPGIDTYLFAARQMGFGAVIKCCLQFKEAFWMEQVSDIGFVLSDERIPTWWTQLPDARPLLTGWVGGRRAMDLSGHGEARLLSAALQSLSNIFSIHANSLRQLLVKGMVYNWQQEPFIAGGYSYSTMHSRQAIRLFQKPLENTLYFAGEAFYDGPAPGTVEAALVSGKRVAATILQGMPC